MTVANKDVVIIGGGFAGLSAGVALAERGLSVALLEGRAALGGRAYSFEDPETGEQVDNGQHVLMGCYVETLDFLDRIGSTSNLVFLHNLEIEMLDRSGSAAFLRTARLPGPFHMTGALMTYAHLSPRQRLRLMAGGMKMLNLRRCDRPALERLTVAELMDRLKQDQRARECFWYPLAIATLNEDPRLSSAALLAEVLKRGFFSRRRDSAFVYSRVGLSDLYCKGAARFIERRGGTVAPRTIVDRIEHDGGTSVRRVRLRDGRTIEARCFISATAPAQMLRMLPEQIAADRFFAPLGGLRTSPIICVHVWLDREVTDSAFVGFVGTTTQWLFNKRKIFERRGERHPGYLSFVISGARRLLDLSNEELIDLVIDDLRTMIPPAREARLVRALVLKEKNATMAPAPDSHRLRPPPDTPLGNFFLAGDWTRTGLPATIESAVASGHAAARLVASRLEASA